MAVRIDASGDYLSRSANLPTSNAFTICGWLYLVVDRNANGVVFELVNAAGTAYKALFLSVSGTNLQANISGSATTGTNLSLSTWYHVGLTNDGTNTIVWLNGVADITVGDSASFTTAFILAGSNTVSFINGRLACIKVFDRALVAAEMVQEARTIVPRMFGSVNMWTPTFAGATERLADYSGNGRNWTANGTLADEDNPPVSWGARPWIPIISTGGTAWTQDIAGTLTTAGSLVKQTTAYKSGTLTTAGALVKQTNTSFSGAFTPAGTLVKQTNKVLDGAFTPSGALTTLRTAYQSLSGAFTPAGTLVKQTNANKTASLTTSGDLQKQTNKVLDGAFTPSGALTYFKVVLMSIGGTLTMAGTLVKQTSTSFTATLTTAGSLVKQTSTSFSATLTSAGTLAKQTATSFTATLTTAGTLAKQTATSFSATLTSAGTLVKQTLANRTGVLTTAGSLQKQTNKVLSGVLTTAGAVVKQCGKVLAGTLTTAGTLQKQTNKVLGGVLTTAGALATQLTSNGPAGALVIGLIALTDWPYWGLTTADSTFNTLASLDTSFGNLFSGDMPTNDLRASDTSSTNADGRTTP